LLKPKSWIIPKRQNESSRTLSDGSIESGKKAKDSDESSDEITMSTWSTEKSQAPSTLKEMLVATVVRLWKGLRQSNNDVPAAAQIYDYLDNRLLG
jgi:hypothetical protein